MSTIDLVTAPDADELAPPPAAPRPALPWPAVALACALLAAAGALRHWQAGRYEELVRGGAQSPFPLADLPTRLGPWRVPDEAEGDQKLDARIADAAGCTDNISRTYVDERTGVRLEVIVLYGPAKDVYIHSPELCYPLAGYAREAGPVGCTVPIERPDGPAGRASLASLIFSKGQGGTADRQLVYYAWRFGRQGWTPQSLVQKYMERTPGMYKVHVARRAAPHEQLGGPAVDPGDPGDPCESFLAALLPEIERRLPARLGGAAPDAAPTGPAATTALAPDRAPAEHPR